MTLFRADYTDGYGHTGPPVDWYADRLLPGGTTDWGYFCLVPTRNRLLMIDFDRHRPLSGGINRGRRKKKEKKRENLEIQHCSPSTIPNHRTQREEASTRLHGEN
ncbi:hypothetical protein BHM03_00027052 [Ensete ventricosum]|nr:hypothetical protein BHM03_00027052 [Ensete ventricosum]